MFICPNCKADNQDMFAGMGENRVLCMACDYEFHELDERAREEDEK